MSSINLTWDNDGIVDSYNVYRSTATFAIDDLPAPLVTDITDKSYSDTAVVGGETYFYRVSSISAGVEKVSSEIISVTATEYSIVVFDLTYDEESHNGGTVLTRLNAAPLITDEGLICNGYNSRLSTTSVPAFVNDANCGIQASVSFYNSRLKTTSASEPVLFIGENSGTTAKPRFALSVNQGSLRQDWSYLALEYYDSALRKIPVARSGWKFESAFPKIYDYAIKPKPQALHFIDADNIVVTAHYDDTETKAFRMNLNSGEVTGQFTFGLSTNKHVSVFAKSSNGDIWVSDFDTRTIFKIDLAASFSSGTAQKSNICNFSAMSDVGAISFITLSSVEYIVVTEYNITGSPYLYLIPLSLLTSGYTFAAADRYKRFIINRRVQGITIDSDKLYVSRNRDYQSVDAAGYIERFDNISSYFTSASDGATMTPSFSHHAPSPYPEDCKIRPTTNEFWTMTEGFASVSDSDNWLSIWSSPLDNSEIVNTYTLNKSGSNLTLLINGTFASQFTATPSITAAAISFGGYPTATAGMQAGFSTAKIKHVAFREAAIDTSTYNSIISGEYELNALTVVSLPLTNADAESGTTGWTNEVGSLATRSANPVPKFGTAYFSGGSNAQTISRQRVDLLAATGMSQAILDAKDAWLIENWYQASYTNQDPCGMGLRQLDSASSQINTNYSALVYVPFGDSGVTPNWYKRSFSVDVANGAQYCDSLYRADRDSGTNNDGYIDNISIKLYMK